MYVTPNGAVACKIVLYGATHSGRATFLHALHRHLGEDACTAIQAIDLEGEEAQAFVWDSGQQVTISGRPLLATIITLSGRSRSKLARRALVEASDAVIFIADTRRQQLDNNIDRMNDLLEQLRGHQLPEQLPMVIAYNHSDDSASLPPTQLDPLLNHLSAPSIQTVATDGKGVDAAWLTISSILVPEAENALSTLPQGPEPSLVSSEQDGWLLCCHACESMLEVEEAAVGDVFTCGSCGATIQVINPDTGLTGPAPLEAPQGSQHHSHAGTGTASYGLQSVPSGPGSPISSHDALRPSVSNTSSANGIAPFELAGFDLIKELDDNPLGQRFRLYDQQKGRKVRAFRINAEMLASPGYRVQIEPYVRMAAKVSHPNLLPINSLRWQGPRAYIISDDTPDFESLAHVLARRRNLGEQQAMEVLQQVALGLEEAARSGVIHGHLTPSSILVAGDGRVIVDDIGIPKAHAHLVPAMTGQSPSTEFYLAPEHLLNDAPSDLRTDFFLLGSLLYRMLSAEGLVTGLNAIEALNRFNATGQQRVRAFAETLPRDIASLLTRLTSAERRERFQHYGEVIEAIERCFAGLKRRTLSQTGAKRRSETGSRTRGGTGPLSGAGGRGTRTFTGENTGRRTRKTVPGTTTTTMRGTGNYRPGRDNETGSYRRGAGRRKSGMSRGGIVIIAGMALLLVATIAYVLHMQQQHTQVAIAAPNEEESSASPSPSEGQRERITNPQTRATQAVEAYSQSPEDDSLYQAAREAVAGVSGPQRSALEHRLRTLRDQYRDSIASQDDPADIDPPATESPTPRAPEPDTPRTSGPSQLSAQQQLQLGHLRREQRFADAQAYIQENLGDNETRSALLQAVQGEYERARDTLRQEAEAHTGNRNQLQQLLNPALERWGMDDADSEWAQERIAQAPEAVEAAPHTPTPSQPDDSPAEVADEDEESLAQAGDFTVPEVSPSGFSRAALEADARLVNSLRSSPSQRPAANEAIASLPADDPHYGLIAQRIDLWFQRAATIQHAIEAHQSRLRINNPVAGGSWDVVAPTDNGLAIRSPTGSTMTMRWSDIGIDETANLFQQVARSQGMEGPHLAVAAVVNMVAGQRTQAARIVQSAQQASYDHHEQLQQLLQMDIDREFFSTVRNGMEAVAHRDTRALETVIEQLRSSPLHEHQQVRKAIDHLSSERDTIIAGSGQDFDDLTFDDPDHRNAFPLRSGWMIAAGTYSSSGASSHLQRDDLGNAESLEVSWSLRNRQGTFSFDFRGVTITGNPENNRLSIHSAGLSTTQHHEFTFDTTTKHSLRMQHDPLQQHMIITVNRLDPIQVRVPRTSPSLRISTTGGCEIAMDQVTIHRFGRRDAVHAENVARKQAALTSLGLTPYGDTVKDPESPAIIVPEGEMMSGLGIPLREGEKGITIKVTGNAPMRIRVGPLDQGTDGDFVPFAVPELGATPTVIRILIGENNWELDATQPNGERVVFEHNLPDNTNGIVVLGEGLLMIHEPPETVR
ncbi:MAG: hypothetical protein EA401_06545 [Planctomycetota bacterium]|nr:MAG: hypothetical protein EA401_06545 [Planctomycetota bacterium]